MKMNKFKLHLATQMKLTNPTLNERNQTQGPSSGISFV